MTDKKQQTTKEIIKELNDAAFLMNNYTVIHLVNIATSRLREQEDRIEELESQIPKGTFDR